MKKIYFFVLLLAIAFHAEAQSLKYKKIPFLHGLDTLLHAGAGGLNSPQFSEVDMNNDGIKDLLVYDRSAWIALTFINYGTNGQVDYTFAPEYMSCFPQNTESFMLARDYNCDGIEDLFLFNQPLFSTTGIGVMRGSYDVNNKIKFTWEKPILHYESQFGDQELFAFRPDLPGVEDIDGDGDVDIAAFTLDFVFNRNIWYYRNMSVENGYGCDSLIYVLEHSCYGMASETPYNRNTYFLSPRVDSCADNIYWPQRPGGPRHTGSTVTLVDWNIDGAMDLVVGDVSINTLNMLTSSIVNDTALFVSQDSIYPTYNTPVDLYSFPGAYFVDIDNDGDRDMLCSPTELAVGEAVYDSVVWLYQNNSADTMWFDFQKKNFLVEDMTDFGRDANPAVVDVDGDGLLDIISGHFGYLDTFQIFNTSLAYYRNTGTGSSPAFTLQTLDYGGFSALGKKGLAPTFGDLDADGDQDMLLGNIDGNLIYVPNTAGAGNPMAWGPAQNNYKNIQVINNLSMPQLVDIDRDGDLDIMMGDSEGRLYYHQNTGNASTAGFSATATSNTFGFDLQSYGSGMGAPFFYDNNGSFELFLGHEMGTILHFGNIDGNITGLYDTLSLNYGDVYVGRNSKVAIADLDRDDTLDFVVGNLRGGITVYSSDVPDSVEVSTVLTPVTSAPALIFPNPTNGQINIRFEAALTQTATVRIFDALGRQCQYAELPQGQMQYGLSLSGFAPGMYFLHLQKGDGKKEIHKLEIR